MFSRISNYVRKNKVKVGLTSIGVYLGCRSLLDAVLLFHNPYRIEYKLNAVWNKFNPFYPTRLINKSMIINKGNDIQYDDAYIGFLSRFCDVVPKLGITPQLIYTLLSNGANVTNCNDLTNKMFGIYKTQKFWEKCVNINPAFYPNIPPKYQTTDMDILYLKSFKVGSCFVNNTIPTISFEQHRARSHPKVKYINNSTGKLFCFKSTQKDDQYTYIFNGYFHIDISKEELNEFWTSLLRYDHKYRCLFPYAPTDVQNSILEEVKSFKLHELRDFVMTGEQFNKLDVSKEKLVKNVKSNNVHYDLKLKLGLNIDPMEFNPYCDCCSGGIYATTEKYQRFWKSVPDSNVYQAEIPNDPNVNVKIEDNNKFKATKIILKPFE
jgi:hypothetical protein